MRGKEGYEEKRREEGEGTLSRLSFRRNLTTRLRVQGRNGISGQTSRWKIEFFHERTDKWTNRVENVVRIVTRRFFLYTEMIRIARTKKSNYTYQSKFIIIRNDKNRSHTENVASIKENTARFSKGEILWRGGTNEVERKKEEEENKSDGKERLFGRGNDSRARASGQEKTAKERSP